MQRLTLGPRQLGQLLGLAQHADRLVGHLFAERGETHDAAGSLDEGHAEQGFQLAQAGGKRRLGDEAGIRRLAEMPILAQRDEILELLNGRRVNSHSLIEISNQNP